MEESATIVDNQYEVGMLWSQNNPQLPNNRYVTINRLLHLKNRLKKDIVLHQKYREKIEEYVKMGYAENYSQTKHRVFQRLRGFFPHHAVFHPAKPGKIRIVFDAAAKFEDTCL